MQSSVTYLTDLPELDQLEKQHHPNGNHHVQEGFQKFIRNNGGRPGSDGMYRTLSGMEAATSQENFQAPAVPLGHNIGTSPSAQSGVSCRAVYLHAMNCPVCMAYYNRDNTALYIVLVSLIIVVLFLLKKHYDLCFVGAPPKKQ